jgi:hypothetical protein
VSLRDDVRWVRELADGLLVGWWPSRLPPWSTKEGEQLGWLVLLLWRRYYEASMARNTLEARVRALEDDVDGLRETNRVLTDLLEAPKNPMASEAGTDAALLSLGEAIYNTQPSELDGGTPLYNHPRRDPILRAWATAFLREAPRRGPP